MSTLYTMVAPCFFGTESTLNFEVKRLGAQNIQVTDGRVAFQGGADVIAAANLNLRTAERVLLLLATYKATTFDELFDGCYNIAWEDLLPANAAFPVKGSSLSSQLSSVPACQSIVKKAIVKRLMHGHKVGTLPEDGALYKVRFALRKDTVEIYLDTSGDGLHKRGYRKNATLAPIKETLAAAIADLGRVCRDSLVQDPFCGSGTIAIEAASIAANMAPGLNRSFAFESLSGFDLDLWQEMKEDARAAVNLHAKVRIEAHDISSIVVEKAIENARRAGFGAMIDDGRLLFSQGDAREIQAPEGAEAGLVIANPPYGEQSNPKSASIAAMMRDFAAALKSNFPGWTAWLLTSDRLLPGQMRLKESRKIVLFNGPLECRFFRFDMVAGSNRRKPAAN